MPLTGVQVQDKFTDYKLKKGVKIFKINDELETFDITTEGTIATERAVKGYLDIRIEEIKEEYLLKSNGNYFNPKDNIINPRLGSPEPDAHPIVLELLTSTDDTAFPNQEIIIYNDDTELRFNNTMKPLNSDIRFHDWTFGVDNWLFVRYNEYDNSYVGISVTDTIAINWSSNMIPDPLTRSHWFNKKDGSWYESIAGAWVYTDSLCLIGRFNTDASTVTGWDIDNYMNLFSNMNVSPVENMNLYQYDPNTVLSTKMNSIITVYDKNIQFTNSYAKWTSPTDFESGVVTGTNYLYLTNTNKTMIMNTAPIVSFGGQYHPNLFRRCVGEVIINASNIITSFTSYI